MPKQRRINQNNTTRRFWLKEPIQLDLFRDLPVEPSGPRSGEQSSKQPQPGEAA